MGLKTTEPEQKVQSASHPSDELGDLVVEYTSKTGLRREEAEARLDGLFKKITLNAIKSWSDTQKLKTCYYLFRLKSFGFRVEERLVKALYVKPNKSDATANAWYYLVQKEMGKLAD